MNARVTTSPLAISEPSSAKVGDKDLNSASPLSLNRAVLGEGFPVKLVWRRGRLKSLNFLLTLFIRQDFPGLFDTGIDCIEQFKPLTFVLSLRGPSIQVVRIYEVHHAWEFRKIAP